MELNPGPPKPDSFRPTRLVSVSASRTSSIERSEARSDKGQTQRLVTPGDQGSGTEQILRDVMSMLSNMSAKFDEIKKTT